MNQVQKKYVILGSLCALVLTLTVGYAAFQSVLKINGTTNISSDWDVKITAIEKTASVGATDNEESPTYDNTKGLSATFNTNLTSPGDYATYKITITNNGSLDAILKTITIPENTNNDIIFYLNKDQSDQEIAGALKQNDTLTKSTESNNVGYVYVTVLYKDYENQQTAQAKTASMTISFDFEQKKSGGSVVGPAGDIASNYTGILYSKNVLTGANKVSANYILPGDAVDKIKGYAKEDASTLGHFYLKHIINNGQVESNELCFVTNTENCMKFDDYENNNTLLSNQEPWFVANGDGCTYAAGYSYCRGNLFSTSITTSGGVDANDDKVSCSIGYQNNEYYAYCYS